MPPRHSKLIASPKNVEIPLPELSDFNYFVATLYLSLLPEQFVRTDINQLETEDREEENSGAANADN